MISDSPPQEPPGELAQAEGKTHNEADQKANAEKKDKKSLWKMMVTPVVLVLLGLALLPVALSLYPSSAETSAPAYSRLSVLTDQHITFIDVAVSQLTPALAKIVIDVYREPPEPGTSAPLPTATLIFNPPIGTKFPSCSAGCKEYHGPVPAFTWTVPLAFNAKEEAVDSFFVRAKSLGVSANGVNALAVLPEVFYQGQGIPEILVGYHIPSAPSYDWSALPPAAYTSTTIAWTEPVTGEDTPPKVAVGINQSRQSSDNHLAFIAGALIGLAGGAVLSGIQEALGRIFSDLGPHSYLAT